MHNDIYMLWLSSMVAQIGSQKLNLILDVFGTARDVFFAKTSAIKQAAFLSEYAGQALAKNHNLQYIEDLLEKMKNGGVAYFSRENERFPSLLKEIPDPPVGIFCIGTLPSDNTHKVAIIGSRKCSQYGLMAARSLAKPLAKTGIVIVSGMARGIDSMAHRGALEDGGETIAVLGCGVDICYPSENKNLREEIINSGCVISEYPPGTRPAPAFFPARNRIISGLSRGVVVTEAGDKSGTLITVNQAIDQGREVFAVPGNIFSRFSKGTNRLISEGATLVHDHDDILFSLKISAEEKSQCEISSKKVLAPEEKQVYDILGFEPVGIDSIVETTGLNLGRVMLLCSQLEIKGFAKKIRGAQYIKS
ncbi:MAG: DNA-processing protein DprA [Defluviitaleaceae bacterium]|nr:DNA-processing protein DprA [Defluviitaleaceae bacterium]MCL2263496.1 DNA-processing protein DprA [Defluviitaleaceae bacterium]MCL2263936.1 DNA-processing protein DprA [Defluviitaleaceae bacterium]